MDQDVTVVSAPQDGNVPIPSGPSQVQPPQEAVTIIDQPIPAVQVVEQQSVPVAPPPAVEQGTLPVIAGYLNIGVGLVVLAIFGMYFAGFGIWITHLKVTGRDEGIHWMERAVITLFWLIVVLALVRFAQYHTQAALMVLGFIAVAVLAWLAVKVMQASGGEDEH